MDYLTVSEYASLRGCSERYIRNLISQGKLVVEEIEGKGGNSGRQYRIPLASIETKYIKKWKRLQSREKAGPPVPKEEAAITPCTVTMEGITAAEREEIALWKKILAEWQEYRNKAKSKKRADEEFVAYLAEQHPDMKFSQRILYRKLEAANRQGDMALLDRRGKHGNHAKAIPDAVFDIFEYYYLDESRKTVARCMELTELEIRHNRAELQQFLPLASPSTFARAVDRIPVPVRKYYRFGEKVFRDECAPYIRRIYDDLASNDVWVCDNHTFDVFVDGGEGSRPIRVYLTGFLDVRSRKMVGWYVTDAPRSDATLYALRRGIERYGIPKMVYSDNGREFLTHDIGGRGFRKSAKTDGHEPPTILRHLGIEFRTALVKNAKAKIIERAFREVKECFSRLFAGYTGGTIAERPERLKKTGRLASNFTLLEEFAGYVDVYIEGHFNKQPHKGVGMGGRTPDQVYAQCLYEQRTARPDELNLMMLRNSRMVKVQRDGVSLKLYDKELYFNSEELLMNHIGEKVYFRYDPDNLEEVRVYDGQDRFLCTAQQKGALSYFASKEEVQKAMKENRELEKTVKAYMKKKGIEAEDALKLILEEAAARMGEPTGINPKIVIPVRMQEAALEEEAYMEAVGAEPIDWSEALERFRAAKEE